MVDDLEFLPPPGKMTKERAETRRRRGRPLKTEGESDARPLEAAHLPPSTTLDVVPTDFDPNRRISKAELVDLILAHVPAEVIAQRFNITEKQAERYIRRTTDDVVLRMVDLAERMMYLNLARLEHLYQAWMPMAMGKPLDGSDSPETSFPNEKAAKVVIDAIKTQQSILKDIRDTARSGDSDEVGRGENAAVYIENLEVTLTKRSDLFDVGARKMAEDLDFIEGTTASPSTIYSLADMTNDPGKITIDGESRPPDFD